MRRSPDHTRCRLRRPHRQTAVLLLALADGPKQNRELQLIIDEPDRSVANIMWRQTVLGCVTRIDGLSGAGTIATYALTEAGKRKIGL